MARQKKRAWAHMVGKLPAPPVEETVEISEHMKKVFEAQDERRDKNMEELVKEYEGLDDAEVLASVESSKRAIKYQALERIIYERLKKVKEASGQDMWRNAEHTFSPRFIPRPVVENPQALLAWVREKNMEALLTLPSGRLNSIIAEAYNEDIVAILSPDQRATLEPGDPGSFAPPPGVKVFLQEGVHHTSKRKKPTAEEDSE
jgi:hypothetical protein